MMPLPLGMSIRVQRVRRGMKAKELSELVGISPSVMSRIENDISAPTIDVLRKIAVALSVSIGDLVEPIVGGETVSQVSEHPRRVSVVRAGERKVLRLPQSGIEYQLLTPDFRWSAEFVWVEFGPGDGGAEKVCHKGGEEYVLVLEGVLHVYVGEDVYALARGDSLVFDARLPHRYKNEGNECTIWVYVAIPPTL